MQKIGKESAERPRAATADVLGLRVVEDRPVGRKWADFHAKLTELRDRLLTDRNARTENVKHFIPSFSEHMADAATDAYDRDWALATLSSTQNALYEIDEALDRIQRGTFGICEMTGEPIDHARLKALPWTRFSAAAQAQLEARGQGMTRVRLGRLRGYANPESSDATDESEETPAAELREAA